MSDGEQHYRTSGQGGGQGALVVQDLTLKRYVSLKPACWSPVWDIVTFKPKAQLALVSCKWHRRHYFEQLAFMCFQRPCLLFGWCFSSV